MSNFTNKLAAQSHTSQQDYLGSLPQNLLNSGNLTEYYQTLTDFDFVVAKINHPELGVLSLIDDYDLVDAPELLAHPEYSPDQVKALKLIQKALRLSAHALAKDKTQLAGQLLGRLGDFEVPEIQAMLEVTKQWKDAPWLRPLTPNLTPIGASLLHTLPTAQEISAVAVTPDGKQLISGSYDSTLKVWNLETGEELFTLTGHNTQVSYVKVTPDGSRLISGLDDGTLKVWNLSNGEVIASFTGDSELCLYAVAPDRVTIVAGDDLGRSHFLRLEGIRVGGDF